MISYTAIVHQHRFRTLGPFYLHLLIRIFALSMLDIFLSIYVYRLLLGFHLNSQQALSLLMVIFACFYLFHLIFLTPAIWLLNKKGIRFMMLWGNLMYVFFLFFLDLSKVTPLFLIISVMLYGGYVAFYWTGYHLIFTELTEDKKQGQEIALGTSLPAMTSIAGPIVGGIIISLFGFNYLFLVLGLILVLANYPLKYLSEEKNFIRINLSQVVRVIFNPKEFDNYIALSGMAMTDFIASTVWPLFIFITALGVVQIGILGSFMAVITVFTTLLIGYLIDKVTVVKVVGLFGPLDSLSWILRFFTFDPASIALFSAAQSLTTNGQIMAGTAMVYEKARDLRKFSFILQREIGFSITKVLVLLLLGILFWIGYPITTAFLVCAVATLLPRLYQLKNH